MMPYRFTVTEKWRDSWFRNLNRNQKLLFFYLVDNCDIAGFWECDFDLASQETGIPKKRLLDSFEKLGDRFMILDKYIWIKNFIYHQKNLPLNPNIACHKGILKLINSHNTYCERILDDIEKQVRNKGLLRVTKGLGKGTGNGKGNGKGNIDYYIKLNIPENLNTKEFLLKWQEWQDYRKQIRKKLTSSTGEKQLKKLSQYPVETAIAMLEQTMEQGWQGIFEINKSYQKKERKIKVVERAKDKCQSS